MSFDIHTIETAPEKSKESLEGSLKGIRDDTQSTWRIGCQSRGT